MATAQEEVVQEFNNSKHRAPLGTDIPRLQPDQWHTAPEVLREHGVCIFANVASAEELAEKEEMFWKWCSKSTHNEINRKPENMINAKWKQLGFLESGVIAKLGIGQSDFLWSCRMMENVQRVYQCIWETDDLVTGFDGCGAFRNPYLAHQGENWYTKLGWYHVDQNAHFVPGLDTYQGLLNFYPATSPHSGSTVVVPRSHHRFLEMFADPDRKVSSKNDGFMRLDLEDDFEKYCTGAVQVPLEAGDFLVWDSRTIHCNQGINRDAPSAEAVLGSRANQPLARLVAYICMLPRSRVDAETTAIREQFVKDGYTGPHHPVRVGSQSQRISAAPGYTSPPAKDPRWKLV